jgi:hypothetical protein
MGYLIRAGLSASNSYFVSGSIWFRLIGGMNQNLLSIYTSDANGGPDGGLQMFMTAGSNLGPSYPRAGVDITFSAAGYGLNHFGAVAGEFVVTGDAWHNLAFAIDANHTGVPSILYGDPDPYNAILVFDGVSRGFVTGNFPSTPDIEPIKFSGMDVGIPDLPGSAYADGGVESLPAVAFGDYQIWTGKFIDWSNPSNYSKVVSISGGHGTPVDPKIAAAAFGTQTILFEGNAASFVNNLGTGGAFTKIGTATDFTPAESF